MKKFLCALLVLIFIFTIMTPISVCAATGNEEVEPRACSHSSYTSSYYYSYIHMDNDYHEVYRTERRQCNTCKDYFYTGNPEAMSLERHSGSLSFIRSVHEGLPATHYYVNGGTCNYCHGYYETTTKAYCTSAGCVEVYSIVESETQ